MFSIIIAFPKVEDSKAIKNVLIRAGYEVEAVCTTAAQVIANANELDRGIVVSAYRFTDMFYHDLNNYLPRGFEMLLVASQAKLEDCTDNNIVCLGKPIKVHDLLNTIDMMMNNYKRQRKKLGMKPRQRTAEEKQVIDKAKRILMDRNNMTEEEAHRYIQKTSMDNGTNIVETAQMILCLL